MPQRKRHDPPRPQRSARIVRNGKAGHFEVIYGVVEKFVGGLVSINTALAISAFALLWDIVVTQARIEERQIVQTKWIKEHDEWSRSERSKLVTRDELESVLDRYHERQR